MKGKQLASLLTLLFFIFGTLHQSIGLAFISSPVIQLGPPGTLEKGTNFTVKAKIQDDYGIEKVVLHYRIIGETEYKTKEMALQNESGVYSVTLQPDNLTEPGIQYYVRAVSKTGATSAMPDLRQTTIEIVFAHLKGEPAVSKTKWLLIALGVLAVGALAAAGGGSESSSGGGENSPDPTADVSITTSLSPAPP